MKGQRYHVTELNIKVKIAKTGGKINRMQDHRYCFMHHDVKLKIKSKSRDQSRIHVMQPNVKVST